MQLLTKIKFIVIHHTHRDVDSISKIKKLHIKKYGWEEVGYHYVIGNGNKTSVDGKIYSARSEKFIGAHVYGFNKNSLGIALIGNLDKHKPTEKQIKNLIKLLIKKTI